MPNLKLGKKSNNMYAVHVSLPRGIVEMKSYCKVNGGVLAVSKSEFDFAMAAGMDKLIAAEVVAVGSVSESPAPVVKHVESKPAVDVEVKVDESIPVTSVQMTVEMSEPAELSAEEAKEEVVEEVVEAVEESSDAPKDAAKSRRRRV